MAGDKVISIFAANVVRQFLMAGLLDEIRLNVLPVLLGGGVRLLDTYGDAFRPRTNARGRVG